LSNVPLLLGSGQCCTPCKRMQRAKASAREFGDACVLDEPPELVDGRLAPHAVASRARPAVAMMAAATHAAGGHVRNGRRVTRALSLIMPFSGSMILLVVELGVRPERRHSVWPPGAASCRQGQPRAGT
jgi:hypothetical protein